MQVQCFAHPCERWISSTIRYTREASFGVETLAQVQQLHWKQQHLPNQNHWNLCYGSSRRTVFGSSLWQIGWKHNLRYCFICVHDPQRKRHSKSLTWRQRQDWFPSTKTLSGLQKRRPSRKAPTNHPNVCHRRAQTKDNLRALDRNCLAHRPCNYEWLKVPAADQRRKTILRIRIISSTMTTTN